MGQARAVVFRGPRDVVVESGPLSEPGPGEAVVATRWSGISSGTELLAYRGELPGEVAADEGIASLTGSLRYPLRYGYSCVGTVVAATGGLSAGALVFAFHPHQDRFVVGEEDLVALPAGVDPRCATLFPLVETALQLRVDLDPLPAELVLVSGLGAVGLLTALLLARAGAQVLASEPVPWRRELAAGLGIAAVEPAELPAAVRRRTGGSGAPHAVDCSGAPAALAGLLPLLAHEGEVVVASWFGTRPVPLPLGREFHRRRLTIRSSQVSTVPAALGGRWSRARRRVAATQLLAELPLDRLATSEWAFEAAGDAYAALDRAEPGVLHAALRYG